MKEIVISIAKVVGGGICVSAEDGQKLYAEIYKSILKEERVSLSFSGVTRMTTAFLNAAVGQLYGEFSAEKVRMHLAPPRNTEPWHLVRLKMVVDRAKFFFENQKESSSIFSKITGVDDEEAN